MNNQECKVRSQIIIVNSNKPSFYFYSIKMNKCRVSCNNINDPYAKMCIPDVLKNINLKVFCLMSRTNEIRSTILHETCKCRYRLAASVIINNIGMKINARMNVNNWLIKTVEIKHLLGILVTANVNVINHLSKSCWWVLKTRL